ncbi:hypothetical protein Tther_01705 [Tepidimonas thermarum]|uniref:Uncharacterized protein n=1 Tax=Tepidimonas thermarum TaxID=335431 RepID=A0A554WZT4_9BURK|nr:hypothetical protein [Tepidimonas thermarum]TSE29093.1 hypothetical protein Tther_01705 [Tepidimonas thermarum]
MAADPNEPPLHPDTDAWLRALPGVDYPEALVARFPRIANALAAARDDPDALRQRFDELLHDHRGGRRGFPFDVLMELLALRDALVLDDRPPEQDDATKWVS